MDPPYHPIDHHHLNSGTSPIRHIRILSLNPLILVLALAVYVLLLLAGFITNYRVISILHRRVFRKFQEFDIMLADIDVFSLSSTNFISLLCFTFFIFDLTYGQWIVPSKMVCQLYLALEGFSRISSSLTLFHFGLICSYSILQLDNSTVFSRCISKVNVHYLCLICIFPLLAAILSIIFFEHGDTRYDSIPLHPAVNGTAKIIKSYCALQMSEGFFITVTIYGSVCGYVMPAVALISACILSYVRFEDISDIRLRRYVLLSRYYCILFIVTYSPEWTLLIYDYYTLHGSTEAYERPIAHEYIAYVAHIFSYVTFVGYPFVYLRGLRINRIGHDSSVDSLASSRHDHIAVSLSSMHQFAARDQSQEGLLDGEGRTRTMSSLQTEQREIVNVAVERHQYDSVSDAVECEHEF